MTKTPRPIWRNEKGAATVLVAVSLAALVSMMALGIDIGMLFNAKSEAQRAADSAALAGASAFLDFPAKEAPKPARQRAVEYAIQNQIRNEVVEESEVAVQVNVDSATVTVTVRRSGISTWFAKLLSVSEVAISATATAQASNAGTAQCLKPFAVPDAWEEVTEDGNRNRIQDPGEIWSFDPNRDRYLAYTGPDGDPAETGYGGEWRNPFPDLEGNRYERDYGRQLTIKVTDPHSALVPSFFYPWVLPVDPGEPLRQHGPQFVGPHVIDKRSGQSDTRVLYPRHEWRPALVRDDQERHAVLALKSRRPVSVRDAFNTISMTDPDGHTYELHSFSPNPALCLMT